MKGQLRTFQERIYKSLKKRATSLEIGHGRELKKYYQEHERNQKRSYKVSSTQKLIKQLHKSQFAFIADFHTFEHNCKNLIRIMGKLLEKIHHSELILGLELIQFEHQKYLDAYLSGDITEREFIELINYKETWRFPWIHYQEVLSFLKKNKIRALALNSEGTLIQRDQLAAELIVESSLLHPTALHLVFFGELHVSESKLPKIVNKLYAGECSYTIIHQNLDTLYWNMETKLRKNAVIEFNGHEFSLQTSPPWIKYESMVYWYETLDDDPDYDLHEYIIHNGIKTFSEGHIHSFAKLSFQTAKIFKLDKILTRKMLEDFNLNDYDDLELIEGMISNSLKGKAKSFNLFLLGNNTSFKVFSTNRYFLPSYSANRLTYLSGMHLFYCLSRQLLINVDRLQIHPDRTLSFNFIVATAIWGYLTSKVYNPHRKCDLYRDHLLSYKKTNGPVRKAFLNILDTEKSIITITKNLNQTQFYDLAKKYGHFIADYIFERIRQGNQVDLEFVDLIFPDKFLNKNFCKKIQEELFPNKQYKLHKKRFF